MTETRRQRFRVSRLNYDKPHRCPGWAGAGESHVWAKKWWRIIASCPGQSFAGFLYDLPHWRWRFIRCPSCGVLCLPWVTRKLDPTWQWATWKRRLRNWRYKLAEKGKPVFNGEEYWAYFRVWNFDLVWWKASAGGYGDDSEEEETA
jgi:hypothetical protein